MDIDFSNSCLDWSCALRPPQARLPQRRLAGLLSRASAEGSTGQRHRQGVQGVLIIVVRMDSRQTSSWMLQALTSALGSGVARQVHPLSIEIVYVQRQ
jgi:hypothetical protein